MEIHCFQCKDGFALYQNESQAHFSAYSDIVYKKNQELFQTVLKRKIKSLTLPYHRPHKPENNHPPQVV